MKDLPTEIHVQIFSYLPLAGLILIRGTSFFLRDEQLLSDVHPLRRRLLDIHSRLVRSHVFRASRMHNSKVCKTFDRAVYIAHLKRQLKTITLPPDFEMYILEWPEQAVFDSFWPGLPFEWTERDLGFRRHGWNMLFNIPPQLFNLYLYSGEHPWTWAETQIKVPALPLWQAFDRGPSAWIIMTDLHPQLAGRVVKLMAADSSGPYSLLEDVNQHHNSSVLLPFIDWLSVNAQRYCLGLGEDWYSTHYYDEVEGIWKPSYRAGIALASLPNNILGKGGNFTMYRPYCTPIAPLVSHMYISHQFK